MVDTYGRWTYEANTPENKKCDLDIVADWIMSKGYKPETSIENVAVKIVLHYEGMLEDTGNGYYGIEENPHAPMINIEDVALYVEENGSLQDFDYEG